MYYLGYKKPIVYYKPWLKGALYHYVMLVYTVLSLMTALVSLASITVIMYNTHRSMASILLKLIVITIGIIISLSIYMLLFVLKRYIRTRVTWIK